MAVSFSGSGNDGLLVTLRAAAEMPHASANVFNLLPHTQAIIAVLQGVVRMTTQEFHTALQAAYLLGAEDMREMAARMFERSADAAAPQAQYSPKGPANSPALIESFHRSNADGVRSMPLPVPPEL
ncbi:MAG: hypothetical protein ACKVP3_11760 [Hyphomicrobiaceae bacterium]